MIALLLLFSATFCVYSQDNPKPVFVEFVVDGDVSVEVLRKINQEFRANPDFLQTRMDIPTERFFGVYKAGISFDQKWFENEFLKYGLSIHCINTGFVGEKPYQHMASKDCPEINSK